MFGMLFLIYSLGIYANVNLIVFLTTATALRSDKEEVRCNIFFLPLIFHLYSNPINILHSQQ